MYRIQTETDWEVIEEMHNNQNKTILISRGSQWGGGIYGYRLKSSLFYGYRLIFFQLRLTKKLKINFFCFKKLNIN